MFLFTTCISLLLSSSLSSSFSHQPCFSYPVRFDDNRFRHIFHRGKFSSSSLLYSASTDAAAAEWNDYTDSKSSPTQDEDEEYPTAEPEPALEGIRLNKVFKATHSRREADTLISEGRVTVNGKKVDSKGGFRVLPYVDIVALDGKVVRGWEDMNYIQKSHFNNDMSLWEDGKTNSIRAKQQVVLQTLPGPTTFLNHNKLTGSSRISSSDHHPSHPDYTTNTVLETPTSHFDYVKYWKPLGITCTTDTRKEDNIIDALKRGGYKPKHRIYPVGRLDKDSSGLILLTSDGRVPNAVLRGEHKQAKVYEVRVDKVISDGHIQRLQEGIVITTVAHRDGNRAKPLTAKTRPCQVIRINSHMIQITLMEGRNRQIRKMLGALDYTVLELQRIEFMGIQLQDKDALLHGPGDWRILNNKEMSIVERALKLSSSSTTTTSYP